MDDHQYWAAQVTNLVNLLVGWAWPAVVVIFVLTFRAKIGDLLDRLSEFEGFGMRGKFAQAAKAVAIAAAVTNAEVEAQAATGSGGALDATVEARESLATKLAQAAQQNPSQAILAAYAEVEQLLKRRMRNANVAGVDRLSGRQLVDVALRKGVINDETADAINGILVLRNLVAHGRDVDVPKAFEYLALADGVIYTFERTRSR